MGPVLGGKRVASSSAIWSGTRLGSSEVDQGGKILGLQLALEDEYIVDLLSMENRDLVPETIAAAGVRYEYWQPIFEHGRASGELRADLTDNDLIRWLSTIQLHFLSQRALYPTIDDIERDVRLFVVPSITNPSLSRLG